MPVLRVLPVERGLANWLSEGGGSDWNVSPLRNGNARRRWQQ